MNIAQLNKYLLNNLAGLCWLITLIALLAKKLHMFLPWQCCISACWTFGSIKPSGRSLRYCFSKLATVHVSDTDRRSSSSPLSRCCFRFSTARTFPLTLKSPSWCRPATKKSPKINSERQCHFKIRFKNKQYSEYFFILYLVFRSVVLIVATFKLALY